MHADNYHSLTLVLENPSEDIAGQLATLLAGIYGLQVQDATVLSHAKAFDMRIAPLPCARRTIEHALQNSGIKADFCIQPQQGRKKKLLICDMDSTLIGQECIDELADFAGVKAHVSDITERAMRGELDFEMALKERVGTIKRFTAYQITNLF